jgi:hypothetical protein
MHHGAMRMSEDFNDPLPDDFWYVGQESRIPELW